MNWQKVKITKSTRGRSKGIAQNLTLESGVGFVTASYSEIDWRAKEIMIDRLARAWNMTAHLSDDEFAAVETHLTKQPASSE